MIIAANFKMNLTPRKIHEYLHVLEQKQEYSSYAHINIILFPNMASLMSDEVLRGCALSSLTLGAQNAYPAFNGAFTGEIGAEILEELNISTLMIGHSERREIFNETQEFCQKKFDFYKKLNFKILYCIGEPLHIRKNGQHELKNYLNMQLCNIDVSYNNLIIAYEPIWAIGSGISAEAHVIEETHQLIKEILQNNNASNIPLLYGGSVKTDNVREILMLDGVDGVLVGSASLSPYEFSAILQVAVELQKI